MWDLRHDTSTRLSEQRLVTGARLLLFLLILGTAAFVDMHLKEFLDHVAHRIP